jgi:hypothetical protein
MTLSSTKRVRIAGRRAAVVACAALCASLLASAVAAARTKHTRTPTVHCVRGFCVTHFLVEISGSQTTAWKYPYQRRGAADCYHVPYARADGQQSIDFTGSGLVEATRFGGGPLSFEYLLHGKTRSGIGEGHATIDRTAHMITHIDPGPCGAGSDVGDHDAASGCGRRDEHWTYDLDVPHPDEVALSAGTALGSLVPGFDGCPLLATGIPSVYELSDLYAGFSEPLPARELFSSKLGKIILFGRRTFGDNPSTRLGTTGKTDVNWTITLTRIPHAVFPIESAPLT